MTDYLVKKDDHKSGGEMYKALAKALEGGDMIVTIKPAGTGKWGMARLWRAWMSESTAWMNAHGFTLELKNKKGKPCESMPVNNEYTHGYFTKKHGLVDADGLRLSWAKKPSKGMRPATKYERWDMMRRHEEFCADRNIPLTMPRDSEYIKLREEQEQ